MIGEYISALSNAATLSGKNKSYLIWGVDDKTHKIIGTNFNYRKEKKGNEELELWLIKLLNPKINFKFYEIEIEEKKVVILEINSAEIQPTKFSGEEYIRIGTNKKKLKDYPDKERDLWGSFNKSPFELKYSKENLSKKEILELLDYIKYYEKLGLSIFKNDNKIIEDFINEKFIKKNDAGLYNITNLGALLIAKDLTKFENLSHKIVRVIWYKGNNKLETIREKRFINGYAISYEEIASYILTIIPQKEVIENMKTKNVLEFPEIAIRELLANALIHQELKQIGTSIMIEIYSDRIEFSNPGSPIISIDRIIDTVPLSRNENLAGFMHKCGICEERGSGYDKIIYATSKNYMIAPKIEEQSNLFTKVTLYSKMPFDLTTKESRVRTCYMYACLSYVNSNPITNSDVRELIGLNEKGKYKASRILKDTLELKLIKLLDENSSPKFTKYIPFWA